MSPNLTMSAYKGKEPAISHLAFHLQISIHIPLFCCCHQMRLLILMAAQFAVHVFESPYLPPTRLNKKTIPSWVHSSLGFRYFVIARNVSARVEEMQIREENIYFAK